ncbi:ImmA/IrrE family metallo-endopeptidase [Devosia naphthalenivorans]|uniref:ImmA/IrrE family metallo-endopeptidase n=1 Tax=Devosia naphthalenivorans TaxID=2082392 RepID=UPI0013B05CC4|nr:ImmA/IrrE family metallo-endopeptidase [Devosia naphthalenivorans]
MTRIDNFADRLREQLGIPDDLRPDALDVLRRMKISKVISDYAEDPEAVGRDARWDADNRVIYLSTALWNAVLDGNDYDARFTVLHEVGHAVLGHTHRNRLTAGKRQFGRFVEADESDADQFALAFAIPLKFAALASTSGIASLADQFGLPQAQTSRRVVDLQRDLRVSRRQTTEHDIDNYTDAMRAMRINAINWNS